MTSKLSAASVAAIRPRVESVPPYLDTSGPEAIALAASAGLYLDNWQQYVLMGALGERADGNWSATEVGLIVPRRNGKGSILEARELFGLVLAGERVILHTAHEFKTCKDAYTRLKGLFESTPDLGRLVRQTYASGAQVSIQLINGAKIDFIARTAGSGRGLNADMLVLDEAYALEDKHLEALVPTVLSSANPQIWYTSSPPLSAATGQPLFNLRTRGESGDGVLAWFDFGQLPDVDIDDPSVWAAANPAMSSGRITVEKLAKARKNLSSEGFSRENLGIWPETAGTTVISPELWSQLADPSAARPSEVAFAVDVTPLRDHAAIVMAGFRPDGTVQLAVVDHREGTDWIPERLTTLKDRYTPVAIAVDGKSALLFDLRQAGITESEDQERPQAGDMVVAGTNDAAAAFGMFVDRVRSSQIHHSDDSALNVALAGAKTRPLGDGSAWARRGPVDISPLVAATLAHWALITRAPVVRRDYRPNIYVF